MLSFTPPTAQKNFKSILDEPAYSFSYQESRERYQTSNTAVLENRVPPLF